MNKWEQLGVAFGHLGQDLKLTRTYGDYHFLMGYNIPLERGHKLGSWKQEGELFLRNKKYASVEEALNNLELHSKKDYSELRSLFTEEELKKNLNLSGIRNIPNPLELEAEEKITLGILRTVRERIAEEKMKKGTKILFENSFECYRKEMTLNEIEALIGEIPMENKQRIVEVIYHPTLREGALEVISLYYKKYTIYNFQKINGSWAGN